MLTPTLARGVVAALCAFSLSKGCSPVLFANHKSLPHSNLREGQQGYANLRNNHDPD